MSFDNQYPNRKDHREQYYKPGPKNLRSCRHGGYCHYCRGNRLHKRTMSERKADEKLREYE